MSRVRTKTVTSGFISASAGSSNSNGEWTSHSTSGLAVTSTVSMVDELTPDYWKRRARGEILPCNPLLQTSEPTLAYVSPGGSCVVSHIYGYPSFARGNNAWSSRAGCYNQLPTLPALPDLAEDSEGNTVALAALANARQEAFDLLTFAAEFRETVGMFSGALQTLMKRISRLSSIKGAALSISELWLEYRYGWSPLVADIRKVQELITRLNNTSWLVNGHSTDVETLSSTVTDRGTSGSFSFENGDIGFSIMALGVNQKTITTRRFRASALVELKPRELIAFDPLATSWEIVPFSFVIDWFVNVQANLWAFSPFQQGTCRSLALVQEILTTTELSTYTPRPVGSVVDWIQLVEFQSDSLIFEHRSLRRVPYKPSLELTFQNPLTNVKRAFDALALARHDILRLLRRFNH